MTQEKIIDFIIKNLECGPMDGDLSHQIYQKRKALMEKVEELDAVSSWLKHGDREEIMIAMMNGYSHD